jgi:hypothetical protein
MDNPLEKPTVFTYNQSLVDKGTIYTAELEEGAIRIMTLHRGSGSDVFECDLRKIRLASKPEEQTPPYEALSYVWGSHEDPEFVSISGNRFAVTQNLFEALTYLRLPDSDRTLWIDAICINQCNDAEKEVQIQQMHHVYGNAREVIAWLGPADTGTHEIFDSISWPGDTIQSAFPGLDRGSGIALSFILGDQSITGRKENALKELASRPYWSRAWIFQEMKFATSLTIQCGVNKVPYRELDRLYINKQANATVQTPNENGELITHFIDNLDSTLPDLSSDQDYPKHFLDRLLNRHCRDRRDNIFAFWNLFPQDLQRNIPISYKTPPDEILLQSARAIINSTGSLYIFVIKGRQITPQNHDEHWQMSMPSWCPYLATPYDNFGFTPQTVPSIFAENARVSFYTNTKLRVKGFVVGWIERSICRRNHEWSTAWTNADFKQEFEFYMRCLEFGLIGAPHEMRPESLWATTLTLLADQDGDSVGAQDLIDFALGQTGDETDENDAKTALRTMQRNIRSRKVCSFQVGATVIKALQSSKTARKPWLNPLVLVPRTAHRGDIICIILGCPLPVVLRKTGDTYRIVGEAFFNTSYMGSLEVLIKLRNFIVE